MGAIRTIVARAPTAGPMAARAKSTPKASHDAGGADGAVAGVAAAPSPLIAPPWATSAPRRRRRHRATAGRATTGEDPATISAATSGVTNGAIGASPLAASRDEIRAMARARWRLARPRGTSARRSPRCERRLGRWSWPRRRRRHPRASRPGRSPSRSTAAHGGSWRPARWGRPRRGRTETDRQRPPGVPSGVALHDRCRSTGTHAPVAPSGDRWHVALTPTAPATASGPRAASGRTEAASR